MKKILTFIPLGVGISAAIIYILNVIQFKMINNGTTLLQILMTLKVYLFISIGGFALYFFIKVLDSLSNKNKVENEDFSSNEYEPFENNNSISSENTLSNINNVNDFNNVNTLNNQNNSNSYVPNYDYVPMYHAEEKQDNIKEIKLDKEDKVIDLGPLYNSEENNVDKEDKVIDLGPLYNSEENNVDKEDNFTSCKYCTFCGNEINAYDLYCSHCGNRQDKKKMSTLLKNIINVLEIVILLLIIYFSLNMLFDYKESHDSSFKSPFKVSMTK